MTEIGDKPGGGVAVVDGESDGILGVVRNTEGFDGEIANSETLSISEKMPGDLGSGFAGIGSEDGFRSVGSKTVGVNGDGAFFAEDSKAVDMVAVFVGDENGGEPFEGATGGGEALGDLATTQPRVN